jgi:hypothetical protein
MVCTSPCEVCYFCPILTEIEACQQIPIIKFHENQPLEVELSYADRGQKDIRTWQAEYISKLLCGRAANVPSTLLNRMATRIDCNSFYFTQTCLGRLLIHFSNYNQSIPASGLSYGICVYV